MSEPLNQSLTGIKRMMQHADIDHGLLMTQSINLAWLENYNHQRILNSFLFNYLKIQDKIGSKLFRLLLEHWRELDNDSMTMLDILNRLEKLGIIESLEAWDKLREIRNSLTHEYPDEPQLRLDNIQLALTGYLQLKQIIANIESALQARG